MIQKEKVQQALHALNFILIRARKIAYDTNQTQMANLLDHAEILPLYIAEPDDRTESYRLVLDAIADQFPECKPILPIFDNEDYLNS